jgi:hypothetical protein
VRLERLGKLKNPMKSGIEPATFRLVAKYLNQLRYRVPPSGQYICRVFQRRIQISTRRLVVLKEASCGFPPSYQVNSDTVPQIRPRPIPSKSFPIHYSLITHIIQDYILLTVTNASLPTIYSLVQPSRLVKR